MYVTCPNAFLVNTEFTCYVDIISGQDLEMLEWKWTDGEEKYSAIDNVVGELKYKLL